MTQDERDAAIEDLRELMVRISREPDPAVRLQLAEHGQAECNRLLRTPNQPAETESAEKVRENRLRRMAHRYGLQLEKSPRRDPRAIGYGTYQLSEGNKLVAWGLPSGYGLSLDDVERELKN